MYGIRSDRSVERQGGFHFGLAEYGISHYSETVYGGRSQA